MRTLTEYNAVEVVQRNLIMLRNDVKEDSHIKKAIFHTQLVKNNLMLATRNGIGVAVLMELCEVMDVDFMEMFEIDPSWKFNPDGTFKEHWDYKTCSETRLFRPYRHSNGVYYDTIGKALRENIRHSVSSGKVPSTKEWRDVLGNVNMTKLSQPFPEVNFGTRMLGRCVDELGLGVDDILLFKEDK